MCIHPMCRKPLAGDESSVVTIDFLRARLLAERASSKAAKERVQQLTIKVLIWFELRYRIIGHPYSLPDFRWNYST